MAVNQGSKGALITWTVVSTVFGITFIVLAGIAFAAKTDAEQRVETLQDRLNEVATESDINSEAVTQLRAERTAANSNQVYLRFAITQGQELAQLATGNDAVPAAKDAATSIIDQTASVLQAVRDEDGAVQLATLSDATQEAIAEIRRLNSQLEASESRLAQQQSAAEQAASTFEQQIAQLRQEVRETQEQRNEAIAATEAAQQGFEEMTADITAATERLAQELGEENITLTTLVDDVTSRADQLNRDLQQTTRALLNRIGGDAMITKADGRVIRSPSENRLIIDLGRRDGVTKGMTFSVYGEETGIPQLSGNIDDPANVSLPLGKASIVLVNVGANSSEARIVAQQPGTTIQEQDLIANLAFDRDSPRRFYIYGEYDFNGDGIFTEREGEQIASLVSEFGGQIVSAVTVDTDIVVLGREPVVPDFTDEELQNPVNVNIV
ncbi:MAG: FlgT C-terminal domain-containing protein, partial [Planctomycetota bacterium]